MKNSILFLLFIVCAQLYAQNPDGNNASLHITPAWLWGNANYSRNTSIYYPQSETMYPQLVTTKDSGKLDYPFAFGIDVMLKIPTASYLTMSVSYSFNQKFEQFDKTTIVNPYFSQYWSLNGNVHKISFTASIYNLFSIY